MDDRFKTKLDLASMNTPTYWQALKEAHALVRGLEQRDDDGHLFRMIVAARNHPLALGILDAQGREDLLDVNETHTSDQEGRVRASRRFISAEGVVRIESSLIEDCEGAVSERKSYLNGQLHDIDGEPAVQKTEVHYIPSEGHLDQDFTVSYFRGIEIGRIDKDVTRRWTPQQKQAFGAAELC